MEHATKTCVVCGEMFRPKRDPDRRTCSNRCYMYDRSHPGRRDSVRICPTCGVLLTLDLPRSAKYCSRGCRVAASKRRNRPIRTHYVRYSSCQHCGEALDGRAGKRFCSVRCEARERLYPGSYAALASRLCEHCGQPVPIELREDSRYCSNRCTVMSNQAIRRARRAQLPAERISRQEIFERDVWICHICNTAVDPELPQLHPWSASLDHLVPLADPRSPGHVSSNVALAHLRCNFAKNARVRAEDWALHRLLAGLADQMPPRSVQLALF